MGITKQKLARLKMLDDLLSNRYHKYSTEDLAEEVSRRMTEIDPSSDGITQRTIQKDLKFLREEWPEFVDIEEKPEPFYSKEKKKNVIKHCVCYAKDGFSIFKKELSDDEKYLLREAMSLLGKFDGLPNLDGLEALRAGLRDHNHTDKNIISLSKNPTGDSNILGELFTAISNKITLEIHYHKFSDKDTIKKTIVYPYLLKEYNRRWFLVAAAEDTGKILIFGLERIDKVEQLSNHKYEEYDGDINELFEDIIGVTLCDDAEVHKIYFWVSNESHDYVKTKCLHESQRIVAGDKEKTLRKKYPSLVGGTIFRIDCKENYELIRDLTSFGDALIVLEPDAIRQKIISRTISMAKAYGIDNH